MSKHKRFIHTEGFAQLSLIDKLEHCTASDIVIATMAPAAIGYDVLRIGHFRNISAENRKLLKNALDYKLARQAERVQKSLRLFHEALTDGIEERVMPNEPVPISSGMDKMEFLTPDQLTPERVAAYWPDDKYPGIADAVNRVQRLRRGDFSGFTTVEETREFHLYNIQLSMSGTLYLAGGDFAHTTPAFSIVRTKVNPFNKAMRDLNREVVLLGAPATPDEKQRIFDYATIKDMVACSFVYVGSEEESAQRAQASTQTLTTSERVKQNISFIGDIRDDYNARDSLLRRTKANFKPWHVPGEDRSESDLAELQITDLISLIGRQELGLKRYDEYVDDRDKRFYLHGTVYEYKPAQRDNNRKTRTFRLD